MTLASEIIEATIKTTGSTTLASTLPNDNSVGAKVRNQVAGGIFGIILFTALKSFWGSLQEVSVVNPRTGNVERFKNADELAKWQEKFSPAEIQRMLQLTSDRQEMLNNRYPGGRSWKGV